MNSRVNLLTLNREAEMLRKEQEETRAGVDPNGCDYYGSMCGNWTGCTCGCKYVNSGGSCTEDNFIANNDKGMLQSPGVPYENSPNVWMIS